MGDIGNAIKNLRTPVRAHSTSSTATSSEAMACGRDSDLRRVSSSSTTVVVLEELAIGDCSQLEVMPCACLIFICFM